MAKPEKVLVFCAHNDDQIIGVGGTIAKYAEEGKEVHVFIFSYGEKSHPHFKREVIVEQRVKEAQKSNEFLGVKDTIFFGMGEGQFKKGEEKISETIKNQLKKHKPSKIFTHSPDDPHPDHRAVYNILSKILEEVKYKNELFVFEVWNVFTFRNRNKPKLVVDITKTFKKKVKAFEMHESQQMTIWTLMWNVYLKAFLTGFNNNVKYAELFIRLR